MENKVNSKKMFRSLPVWLKQLFTAAAVFLKALAVFVALTPFVLTLVEVHQEAQVDSLISEKYADYLAIKVGVLRKGYFVGRVSWRHEQTASYLLLPMRMQPPAFLEIGIENGEILSIQVRYWPFYEVLILFVAGWLLIIRYLAKRYKAIAYRRRT